MGRQNNAAGAKLRTASLNITCSGLTPHVTCLIEESNSMTLWQSPGIPIKLSESKLDGKIQQLKEVLTPEQTLMWNNLRYPLAKPRGRLAGEFHECMLRVVSEGAALYNGLRELGLREVLEQIESLLRDGDKIKISTDEAFFPWDILYPNDFNLERYRNGASGEERPDPKTLWGYRFIIEYSLFPTQDEGGWSPPFKEHQSGAPYISLNLNKSIEDDFGRSPFKPIKYHRRFYDTSIGDEGGQWCDEGSKILDNLLAEDNKATVIYLYCHGSSDSPIASASNRKEMLELGEKMEISPDTLDKKNPPPYLHGPVIILNSCHSAAQSPLAFTSFHRKFRKKKAMGIIGTTIQMPAAFAAAFGRKLIMEYKRGVPLGRAMLLMRRLLVDRDNPLALFYSLQCPLQVRVPRGRRVGGRKGRKGNGRA